jgi:hypothetical protein
MEEITFYSTNNAWVNNGLIIMAQKMDYGYEDEIEVKYAADGISFKSIVDKSITDFIAETMQTLASKGTYNISTAFKVLNNEKKLDSNYYFQDHPIKKGDAKKTESITDKERGCLKKKNYSDNKKKQQIWKMRMSYFGSEDIYLKMGLNFKEQLLFNKLTSYETGKNVCPLCGMPSKTMEEVKEFFNPLFGEHHNNEVDGIGATRKKAKICPKCTILSYFALFDYYIPFYRTRKGEVYLTIPNTMNLEILGKVNRNLSSNGQYMDFHDDQCGSYRTNIKNLPTNSKSASLLALLHNIKNKYHRIEPQSLGVNLFEEVTEKDFKEITEWLFISKSRQITQIKSNENIYKILEPFDDKNGPNVYLVPHFLNSFSFDIFNENEVEKFFNGILTFDSKKIVDGLFRISKESISNVNRMWVKCLPNNSSPLYLFTELFLEKIMGESTMLDDNLRDACKTVGKTIGKGFREDVGMLTKFAYSSGPNEFKKALEDASFRLAKSTALDKNKSFYLDANNLELLMNSINQDNFSDAKTYFVSFMSAYVLSENYRQRKQKKIRGA